MQRGDEVPLRHMRDAACGAITPARGCRRADLDGDRQLLLALVMSIGIVGEAASRVSRETRGNFPEISRPLTAAMRNRLVHAYFDIDADIVWATVNEDLPGLITAIEDALGIAAS